MLQLEIQDYVFPSVHLEANPYFDNGEPNETVLNISTGVKFEFDPALLTIRLTVSLEGGEEEKPKCPYLGQIKACGRFRLTLPEGEIVPQNENNIRAGIGFLVKNGYSILYASIRDYLHTLTSKAGHGGYVLPPFYFPSAIDIYETANKSPEGGELNLVQMFIDSDLARLEE